MMIELTSLAASAAQVLADTDSEGGGQLGLLFLLSGFVFYAFVYLRYRNTDKRHRHESETGAELHNVRAEDRLVRNLTGLSNAKMKGANNRSVRGARNGPGGALGSLTDKLNDL